MPKQSDEVKGNRDIEESPKTREEQLVEENNMLREQTNLVLDRLNRLEGIASQNKLRKYDSIHDPDSQRKTGSVPSFDGHDPIISIKRKGKVWLEDKGTMRQIHDDQVLTIKTHGGLEKAVGLSEFVSLASGNSIQCVVNDWETLMEKVKTLMKKKRDFQSATGRMAKIDTVALLKEIIKTEEEITINVTLSEDLGKTFSGLTLDVPWQEVFNAI